MTNFEKNTSDTVLTQPLTNVNNSVKRSHAALMSTFFEVSGRFYYRFVGGENLHRDGLLRSVLDADGVGVCFRCSFAVRRDNGRYLCRKCFRLNSKQRQKTNNNFKNATSSNPSGVSFFVTVRETSAKPSSS